jgi:uncharacterized protein with GYD domain
MPKYLFRGRYTTDGVKGLVKEGGSSRREAFEKAVASAGGTVEAYYFEFGDEDVLAICDLPDNATAAGVALSVGSSGRVSVSTTVLLTPEDIDAAGKTQVDFRPPGG